MSGLKYEYRQLKITELLLSSTNPRFNPVKHQTEAILAMLEDQKGKLVALAEHILENGLNPTDIILVHPHKKQWHVLEGNRRVATLKLLNEPELVGNNYPKIKREFQKLNSILENALVENIPCVIIEDKNLANEWIRLKHTGENDGAGTVRWDGQQTSRFSSQTGNSDSRILFLDGLKMLDSIPQNYKDRFVNIRKTNFDRLMSDPDVRNLLGIVNEGGVLSLVNGVNKYLLAVLYDLAFEDLSVGVIYLKEDRKRYVDDIRLRVESNTDSGTESIIDADSLDVNNADNNRSTFGRASDIDRSTSSDDIGDIPNILNKRINDVREISGIPIKRKRNNYPVNRKTLIPAQFKLTILHPRIVKIFNELKTMEIDIYPNAVAVLFRVFIELSADCYISKHSISSANAESKLGQKIEAIAEDMEKNRGIMTRNELRPARQMSSSQTQNSSIKTFHSYVHNKDITPSSADLKSAWDDLSTFIENIWG